jgi:hypothetical protein
MSMSIGRYWEQFWNVTPISSSTVNSIHTPHIGEFSFLVFIYVFFLLLTICIAVISRSVTKKALIKTVF